MRAISSRNCLNCICNNLYVDCACDTLLPGPQLAAQARCEVHVPTRGSDLVLDSTRNSAVELNRRRARIYIA
eukprot:6202981-Pleurochrysis_carterae.AAC.4